MRDACVFFFFSSRRRHTRFDCDWSSDVCSSDLMVIGMPIAQALVLTGVALMWHLDFFDSQLLAQNLQAGFDNFPLLAVPFFIRSEERRVGKECRSRWSPYH